MKTTAVAWKILLRMRQVRAFCKSRNELLGPPNVNSEQQETTEMKCAPGTVLEAKLAQQVLDKYELRKC